MANRSIPWVRAQLIVNPPSASDAASPADHQKPNPRDLFDVLGFDLADGSIIAWRRDERSSIADAAFERGRETGATW